MRRFILITILFSLCVSGASAALRLPSYFSDNMMIQRDCPVKIWGWANKGEKVTISINSQTATVKANKKGLWEITMSPLSFGGPYEIVISGRTEKLTLKNVLVGDIWVCSGQSNIEWPVSGALNAAEEIEKANYPRIRLLNVPKEVSNIPQREMNSVGWEECSSQSIAQFSAVGYFFGRKLLMELDIPIGLINATCGATNIETWTSFDMMNTVDGYSALFDKMYSEETIRKISERTMYPNELPSLLYNSMIAPLTLFPIKGVIWYQGESNIHNAHLYTKLFVNLIEDWRSAWKQPDLSFYYVQLPNFTPTSEGNPENSWVKIREAQHSARCVHNTGEVITIDIGEPLNVHPSNKQEVGRRLALIALSDTYGFNTIASGPEYLSMEKEKDSIILTFGNIGERLQVKDKYGYLCGFKIAGADKEFKWAKACIDGNKVIVYNEQVKFPVAVRYAWEDNPDDANLYNSGGLPASPFRTDNW